MKGKVLLYIELILILLLFYFGNFLAIFENLFLTSIFIGGTVATLWSLRTMQLQYFSPFPEPPKKHKLTQSGLYQYVRHPMYTGIMLVGLTLVFSNQSFQILLIYLILIYVLDQKTSLEEKLLSKMYPEYKTYKQKAKKFIPYLY